MHPKYYHIAFFILTGLLLISCGNTHNSQDDYASIQQNWESFIESWNSFNTEGCVNIYTDDAEVIAPEMQPTTGKASIAEFYDFLFASNQSADYNHKSESISISGNQAVEYGHFSVDWVSNEGEPWTFNARVMAHWIKDENGDWKIRRLLFNNPPADGAG